MATEDDRSAMLTLDEEWASLAREGREIERILSFWDDDAVVFPPGFAPVKGKDALREYVADSFATPGFSISWQSSEVVFSEDGTMAYMLGRNEVKLDGPDGSAITTHGRVVTIWRRKEEGQFRCVVEIWNT